MKVFSKPAVLTALCAGAGLVCMCLRQWLLSAGVDQKGLLLLSHPGNVLSWAVTSLVALCVAAALLQKQNYRITPMPLSAVGGFIGAAGYLCAAIGLFTVPWQLTPFLGGILAAVSCVCAILWAVGLLKKFRVHPLLHCFAVVFFMVFLVFRYQQWSAESELQRYFFQVTAGVCLLLTCYHRAVIATDRGNGRAYFLLSRCALFSCIAAIPGSSYGLLYGTMALYLLLDGCSLARRQPQGEQDHAAA